MTQIVQKVNNKYADIFKGNYRYAVLMGGRSAGRSYVASQYALAHLRDPNYFRCAIMRFIKTDIRNSIFQEISDRIEELEIDDVEIKNLSFICGNNQINGIGFRKSQGDQKSKLKSLASYNCVIIEEADEVSEEDFMQLDDSLRTIKGDIKIILLLNPPAKNHWIIKRWFNLEEQQEGFYRPTLKKSVKDTIFIHTTYRDNIANINKSTIENFFAYKDKNKEHYYSMIEGLVTEGKKGRIFKTWKAVSEQEYNDFEGDISYGMDFGFTNDPTALVEVKKHNNKVYTKELIYKKALTTKMISDEMERLGVSRDRLIYADSSEPRLIEELRQLNWNVVEATKGQGSVRAGIDKLLEMEVYYTETSEGITEEVQNYIWKVDKQKEPTNEPIDAYNHCIDAVRYCIYSQSNSTNYGFI